MTAFRKLVRDSQLDWLWQTYPHTCIWCNTKLVKRGRNNRAHNQATIDHFMPTSLGGPNIRENMFLSCQRCNHRRGNLGATRFAHACLTRGNQIDLTTMIRYMKQNRKQIAGIEEYKKFDKYLRDKIQGFIALRNARNDSLTFRTFLMTGKQRELYLASIGSMVELADTPDSKSGASACGFESH